MQEGKRSADSAELVLTVQLLNGEERKKYLDYLKTKKSFIQGYMLLVGDERNQIVCKHKIM